MQPVKKINETLQAGGYNDQLISLYGAENLAAQTKRYAAVLERYGKIYGWGVKVSLYTIPYSIALPAAGAELAVATTVDMIAVVAENGVNITRMQTLTYGGEDNIDFYQRGPFIEDVGHSAAVLRGMLIAFRRAGIQLTGNDIYLDSLAMPGSGFATPTLLATLLGAVLNKQFAKSAFSPEDIAGMVRWTLANYCSAPGYATSAEVVASVCGNAAAVSFNEMATTAQTMRVPLEGISIFTLNTGETKLNGSIANMEAACGTLAQVLGKKNLADFEEAEFYAAAEELKNKTNLETTLAGFEYYTRKNKAKTGAALAKPGQKSAPAPQDAPFSEKKLGGASIWRNAPLAANWAVLNVVTKGLEGAFVAAAEGLFGKGSTAPVAPREQGFLTIVD